MRRSAILIAGTGAALVLGGCSSTQLGGGGSIAQGSAGAAGAQNAASELRRCDRNIGTVTLDESDVPSYVYSHWNGVNSTIPMFRLLAAQSGCFSVVERGAAFNLLEQERALAQGGQLQSGSNVGGGQLVAADFVLRPQITLAENDTGGIGAAVGGLASSFGSIGSVLGSVAGDVTFSEAQTLIYVVNVRSGVQEAIAEGSAKTTDYGASISALSGLPGWASLSGYTSTPQGKVVTASYVDAFNGLVDQLRATR
jgi:curli biogenesis system outer membrane secretion channel CsgG